MVDLATTQDLPFKDQLLHVSSTSVSPLEVAITVAQIIDEKVSPNEVRLEVHRIANVVPAANVNELLEVMQESGFSGEAKQIASPMDNNRVDLALENKWAHPITLAMLLVGVARELDLKSFGVKFPHHFLANIGGEIVDPQEMEVVSREAIERVAKKAGQTVKSLVARASNSEIALRMLNNVSRAIDKSTDPIEALRIIDYKEVLAPERPELMVDRALVWGSIGDHKMCRELLIRALGLSCPIDLERDVRQRLKKLRRETQILN